MIVYRMPDTCLQDAYLKKKKHEKTTIIQVR